MKPEVDFQAFGPRNVLGIGESVHIPQNSILRLYVNPGEELSILTEVPLRSL